MNAFLARLPDPELDWVDGLPYSKRFRDIYCASDGPAETQRVFIEPARLLDRIAAARQFTVVELGFGTGLNFLTLALKLRDCCSTTRVRYIAIERYPLESHDLMRALGSFGIPSHDVQALAAQLPPRVPGWHRRYFNSGDLELTLFYGDVALGMKELTGRDKAGVDAWFLDGFAPSRNPGMWDPAILAQMRDVTKTNGTVTTFSAAGEVRRALQANGFQVRRIEGKPGTKRHTTLGLIADTSYRPPPLTKNVRVVGGGLAGSIAARTLAMKGLDVELIEKQAYLGSATSAIPAAIQHPRYSAANTPLAQYRVHAYAHASALLSQFGSTRVGGLHLPDDGMPPERLHKIAELLGSGWCEWLDADAVAEVTQGLIRRAGAWHPVSAIVKGPDICAKLSQHRRIRIITDQAHVFVTACDVPTIFATGCELLGSSEQVSLETMVIPGQVDAFVPTEPKPLTACIVAHNGYVASSESRLYAGSTYEYTRWAPGVATKTNRARITHLFPKQRLNHVESFRERRVVSSDRLPIVGQVGEHSWVSLAHGSSGTISTPFAAELLASAILQEIPISSDAAGRLLAPERFRSRQARRPNPLTRGFQARPNAE
ncbi:MAG: tRNA (5-methylaminomethyl-2-thiouridine)(34)-methyltransferase MnmD [Gammaproteobacteria bacterium]|nr:tRNA (5-methylaminomethyl-2-thiouridine)(34)-methyltransferase MnmD [Gammaproteobacteria bacterium]